MPCYSPLIGYRATYLTKNGKRPIVFNKAHGYTDMEVKVPCGKCRGCRLEYSRQWAIRCIHEASMHDHNAFITLTFDNEHYPKDHSIHKEDLQKFFKRLRKNTGKKFRYFACGEYGEKKGRPHYHAIIFGYDFPDKRLFSKKNGNLLFRSEELEKAWPYGYVMIGDVTFESAAYVARYVMKKYNNKDESKVDLRYSVVDEETGEIFQIEKEFCLMSRRPGIGKDWYLKYKTDTDKDYITYKGKKMGLPKYYDSIIQAENELEMVKRKARRRSKVNEDDNTYDRLRVKEKVKNAQLSQLKRGYENGT